MSEQRRRTFVGDLQIVYCGNTRNIDSLKAVESNIIHETHKEFHSMGLTEYQLDRIDVAIEDGHIFADLYWDTPNQTSNNAVKRHVPLVNVMI